MAVELEIQKLRVLRAVRKAHSLSGAGREIGLSQPAITTALKTLTQTLKQNERDALTLYVRIGGKIRLTPEGLALLELARPVVSEWEKLYGRFKKKRSSIHGSLRIGAGEGAVLYLLPPLIRKFQRKWRQVEIVVRNQSQQETIDMLRNGELDVGLRSLRGVAEDLDYRMLPSFSFERVLLTSPKHPLTQVRNIRIADLAKHRFVMPASWSTTRKLVEERFHSEGRQCRIAVEANGWEVIKSYVGLGLGIAVVPAFCLRSDDKSAFFSRSVAHLFEDDEYGIVTVRKTPHSLPVQEFLRLLDPNFKSSMAAKEDGDNMARAEIEENRKRQKASRRRL